MAGPFPQPRRCPRGRRVEASGLRPSRGPTRLRSVAHEWPQRPRRPGRRLDPNSDGFDNLALARPARNKRRIDRVDLHQPGEQRWQHILFVHALTAPTPGRERRCYRCWRLPGPGSGSWSAQLEKKDRELLRSCQCRQSPPVLSRIWAGTTGEYRGLVQPTGRRPRRLSEHLERGRIPIRVVDWVGRVLAIGGALGVVIAIVELRRDSCRFGEQRWPSPAAADRS